MTDPSSTAPPLGNLFGQSGAASLAGRLPAKGQGAPPPDTEAETETADPEPQTTAETPPESNAPGAEPETEDKGPGGRQDEPEKPLDQEHETEEAAEAEAYVEDHGAELAEPAQAAATFQVSVYLLPTAVKAADRLRRSRRSVNAAVAFDALDARKNELRELVTARKTGLARPADSMFPSRLSNSTRGAAAQQGRRQLWSFQATEAELDILDQLCEDTGATSRSELVSVAMEAHLLPRRRSSR
jgi:hypothetical protein